MSLWKPASVLPFCLAGCALILFPLVVAGGAAPARAEGEPRINITSDQMEYLSDKDLVIFTGNALAVREDMTLSADKMEVTLAGENSDGGDDGSVSRIVATGNVHVRQVVPATETGGPTKERFGTGERGEYRSLARRGESGRRKVKTKAAATAMSRASAGYIRKPALSLSFSPTCYGATIVCQ